jgi:metal-responsive CopG/Arc/MetJ family transcriptional regulator
VALKSFRVQIDEPTFRALNRLAPMAGGRRSEFVRSAIKRAIREAEEDRTHAAHRRIPDLESAADDWSDVEAWKR